MTRNKNTDEVVLNDPIILGRRASLEIDDRDYIEMLFEGNNKQTTKKIK